MPQTGRTDLRYPTALPAVVAIGGHRIDATTVNVSFEGCFIDIADETILAYVKPGQYVQVSVLLPASAGDAGIEIPATVVHVVRPSPSGPRRASPRRSGLGVRFFGRGRAAQNRWDAFVSGLRATVPLPETLGRRLPRGEHFEPVLYRSAHHVAEIRVYVHTVADLYAMLDPNFERLFIASDEPVKVGDELGLQLVHPDSGDIFELSSFVTRIDQTGVARGIEVELLNLDAERRKRLAEFADDGLEAIFDDAAFVDDTTSD